MLYVALSAAEKLKDIEPSTWLKIGIGIVAFVVAVVVVQKIAKANKVVMGVIVFVAGTIVFFSWVYNRNEPAFMKPIIDKIAPFFPSAGSYGDKQKR